MRRRTAVPPWQPRFVRRAQTLIVRGILTCTGCGVTPILPNGVWLRPLVACNRIGQRSQQHSAGRNLVARRTKRRYWRRRSVTSAERLCDRQSLIEIGENVVDMLD